MNLYVVDDKSPGKYFYCTGCSTRIEFTILDQTRLHKRRKHIAGNGSFETSVVPIIFNRK